MGSLPNLKALCDDPAVPYKHALREPEDLPRRTYGPAVGAFNSQHYVDRCRVDQQDRELRVNQLLRCRIETFGAVAVAPLVKYY